MAEAQKKTQRSKVWRVAVSILKIVSLVYVGLAAVLYFFQSRLVFYPFKDISSTPKLYGLDYEEVSFQTEDGTKLAGWFIPAEDAEIVILFCHGNAGNISHRLDSLAIFNQLGISVLIFDYRGYGRSEGKPSEAGTYQDAAAAWDYLVNSRKVAPERIIIFGRSLGAAVAANLAKDRPPKAMILESAFTSVPDLAAGIYPFLPVRLLCKFSFDTKSAIAEVKCPILIIHSDGDDLIDFSHGRKLFDAASEPKEFLQITGTHNEGFVTSGAAYTDGLQAFLDRHGQPVASLDPK